MTDEPRDAHRGGEGDARSTPPLALTITAIVILALELRSVLVAPAPVAAAAEHGWRVSAGVFGLLTTVPVACFALTTVLASVLARRVGLPLALALSAAVILAATVLRSVGPFGVALLSTVLLGAAITVGNVLVPAVIRRDVPERHRSTATGIYTTALNAGALAATLTTVPLAAALGWRVAIAFWAIPAVLACVLWGLLALHRAQPRDGRAAAGAPASRRPLRRDPLVRLLAVAMGAQFFAYYGITTWLPQLLHDQAGLGASASAVAASSFQAAGLVGGFAAPVLARRIGTARMFLVVGVLFCALPAGLLVLGPWYVAWIAIGGLAQGAGFSLVFLLIASGFGDARATAAASAAIQTVAYLVAAAAPPGLGLTRTVTGGWALALVVALAATVLFTVVGRAAARRSA